MPVGTSLSGGTDSTLVVDLVRSIRPDAEIHAFTASFPGTELDELPPATRTAEQLGLVLHPVPLDASDLYSDLDALHLTHESPVESPSVFAQYAVMRRAAESGITVLLDGQGGDETWSGYPKYVQMALMDDLATGHPVRAAVRAKQWKRVQGQPLRVSPSRYLGLLGGPRTRRLVEAGHAFYPRWLSREYRRNTVDTDPIGGIDLPAVHFGRVSSEAPARDMDRVMLPRLLRYADRNSMAWSREVRLPYLDHRLVEMAVAVPSDVKLARGWTKEPLRELLEARNFGITARTKGKLAYTPPTAKWLRTPPLSERVADAWSDLSKAGVVASPEPSLSAIPQWRVLSLVTWARAYAISLT